MRIVVLGAGASYGASDYATVRPPLVDQFFSAATRHGLLDATFGDIELGSLKNDIVEHGGEWEAAGKAIGGNWSGHLSALTSFIDEQLGVRNNQLGSQPVNIERLFGLIEAALLGHVGYDQVRGERPSRSYADVLEQQLYLVICGSLIASTRGVRCEYHRKLADWLDQGDIVLSFNYDLLMDRALADRGDWWINDGYGVGFHRVGKWSESDASWRVPLVTNSRLKLLKPHGSLNWLFCRDPWESNLHVSLKGGTQRPPANAIYCLEDMHSEFERDWPLFEWWARYEHENGDDGYIFDLHSLIVPPAITKHYRDYEQFIGGVWANALNALLNDAQELIFVGYSLRPEDLRSWWLFRTVAAQAVRLRRIQVVDPSADVLARVKSVFDRHDVSLAAPTLADFVDSL